MLLLTGATGFLGRALVPQLLAAGYPVRALVRPSSDVSHLTKHGVDLAYADDISDVTAVGAACAGCRYVVHAAARFRFWGDLPDFWQTNVGGTAAVLAAAADAGVERFVHLSTVAVVGQPIPGRVVDESHPDRPQDFYQRTKWEAEKLALAYHRRRDLPVIVLRPGAFYGPHGRYAFNRLFFEEPLRGWRVRVDGGRHLTFPLYIKDAARSVLLALEHGRSGVVYNICGRPLTHNQVNAIVSDLAGISPWRLDVPGRAMLALAGVWTALARFTGREPFYPVNLAGYVFNDWPVSAALAEAELGFRPTPFTEGAQQTVNWYRSSIIGPQ